MAAGVVFKLYNPMFLVAQGQSNISDVRMLREVNMPEGSEKGSTQTLIARDNGQIENIANSGEGHQTAVAEGGSVIKNARNTVPSAQPSPPTASWFKRNEVVIAALVGAVAVVAAAVIAALWKGSPG